MSTLSTPISGQATHPVRISVEPALDRRNRLTTAFRFILVLPHLLLVGGPAAAFLSWTWNNEKGWEWSAGTGVLGAAAGICTLISWFAILFTGRHPDGLWRLSAFYLRWRVRVSAYTALLCDEYPPFGDDPYPASLELRAPEGERDRMTVALRVVLAIPHLLIIWLLGIAWGFTTLVAWFAILFTGRFPAGLYRFSMGIFRWITRVEAYLLLLHDEYPPFSLE